MLDSAASAFSWLGPFGLVALVYGVVCAFIGAVIYGAMPGWLQHYSSRARHVSERRKARIAKIAEFPIRQLLAFFALNITVFFGSILGAAIILFLASLVIIRQNPPHNFATFPLELQALVGGSLVVISFVIGIAASAGNLLVDVCNEISTKFPASESDESDTGPKQNTGPGGDLS
jgi:hypothetical protein